ncbi:MAG TPA: BON domain-containing protein [Steroidobacteraceae bacterium]|nr:BON domain-containing protein [Steroidobacteraceae bacterium]
MKLRTIADKRAAVASVVATMLFALGCASGPPESPEQAEADAATARRVYAALQSDRLHLFIGLDVRVHAGVANINGLTFDASVRDRATEIARSVPGVIRVVNQIDVEAGSGP